MSKTTVKKETKKALAMFGKLLDLRKQMNSRLSYKLEVVFEGDSYRIYEPDNLHKTLYYSDFIESLATACYLQCYVSYDSERDAIYTSVF